VVLHRNTPAWILIGRDGKPIKRFAPLTTPEKLEASILAALDI